MWSTSRIREQFLSFYRERGHCVLPSHSLLPPPGDPVLLVTSGMHPLVPYLLGTPHGQGRRLTNSQRCVRTTDLDEVGDTTHLTLFEMLGSWSLGEYDHPQSLQWGWELLTDGFGLDPSLLCVSVFGGSEECEGDRVSERVWQRLGLSPDRIHRGGMSDNWWSMGDGPCGPDSEVFYWTGDGEPSGSPFEDSRWVEVSNHVSTRYERTPQTLRPLSQVSVDHGSGLERLSMVLQGVDSVHEIDDRRPWTDLVGGWGLTGREQRIVSDHLRTSVVLLGEGVRPSNTGSGYVLRRLLRRSMRLVPRGMLMPPEQLVGSLSEHYGMEIPPQEVFSQLQQEQMRWDKLLERSRREIDKLQRKGPIGPQQRQWLYETHGIPEEACLQLLNTE